MDDMITISVCVPSDYAGSIYAAAALACGTSLASGTPASGTPGSPLPVPSASTTATTQAAPTTPQSVPTTETVNPASGNVFAEVDAAGVPWDAARHASTKGTTKDGLWRMKVGVSRPENEGLPANGATAPANSSSETPQASTSAPADEFAAWTEAANAEEAANGTVIARTWTDADLSLLCNQAAIAAGSPDIVKCIIKDFVPEGGAQHSRFIPTEHRQDFADALEAEIDGFKFAG